VSTTYDAQRAERERALIAALAPWKVDQLRAIQAAWQRSGNREEDSPAWTLLDVVNALIELERDRVLKRAAAER
jgi:hypothetical protein